MDTNNSKHFCETILKSKELKQMNGILTYDLLDNECEILYVPFYERLRIFLPYAGQKTAIL